MLTFDEAQAIFCDGGRASSRSGNAMAGASDGRRAWPGSVGSDDTPAANRSAMDGYSVCCEEYEAGTCLPVQQVVYAGTRPQALRPGHAIRIYTGRVIPEGADAVVAQEDAVANYRGVICNRAPVIGQRRECAHKAVGKDRLVPGHCSSR